MNILPKKRWHVRTKENIARVRKDEAEAAEKEKLERIRTERADREARLNVLKHKSKEKLLELGIAAPEPEKSTQIEHINLFSNFEDAIKTTNKDHESEVKEKKEEYEKKIGYLTYLGQDTNEALGKKNWYEVLPETRAQSSNVKDTYDKLVLKDEDGKPKVKEVDEKNGEVGFKRKQYLDPMNAFKHLHGSHKHIKSDILKTKPQVSNDHSLKKHKSKKHKKEKKNDKLDKLKKLREARLKREMQEKHRTDLFLTGLNKPATSEPKTKKTNPIVPKYNSQFNPELARQNFK